MSEKKRRIAKIKTRITKAPRGFKSREEYNAYMREYQDRQRRQQRYDHRKLVMLERMNEEIKLWIANAELACFRAAPEERADIISNLSQRIAKRYEVHEANLKALWEELGLKKPKKTVKLKV